jgi:GNAT superfamily N-acetyltransferase
VYLEDIYILPEYRKNSIASTIANEIASLAKAKGCTRMLGSVIPTANNSTDSLKVLMAYGMKLDSCTNNFILLSKGIV